MSFDAELFRQMPPSQYGAWMTDPYTGLRIPKGVAENLAWRKKLVHQAKTSGGIRRALKAACAASPIFWLNSFGWTYLQKKVGFDGTEHVVKGASAHVPFITWQVQDQAIHDLHDAIEKQHDALIHKSRDMGASWIVVGLFQWYFQFRPSTSFLEVSRKEVLVDRRGDMDALFPKHRYLMERQPEWLRPQRIKDNAMHLENQDIGSSILGESTNENAGQASRKTAMLLDEFARVRDGEEIDLATADTSGCRIFNSTPQGPATHFSRIYRAMRAGVRSGKLIIFPWWMHPDKGRGAAVEKDEGEEVVRNDWYRAQTKRRSKRNMAQNIDGDHGKAGDGFFDSGEIERHRKLFQRDPIFTGNIKELEDLTDDELGSAIRAGKPDPFVMVQHGGFNPWRFWVPLIDKRPNQSTHYVFGVDISNGSGGSNSVVTVLDHYTNMIVAKFWDAFTAPEELAKVVCRAGMWFGGVKPPLVIFEKNGPGSTFGRKLMKLGYPNVYYQEVLDQKSKARTRKWGWHSSDTKKEILLGEYRDALKMQAVINPCKEALDEALDYVYDSNGKIEPGSKGVEEGGGNALHGDHVIADGLVVRGRAGLPKNLPKEPHVAPKHSFAWRKKLYKDARKKDDAWAN